MKLYDGLRKFVESSLNFNKEGTKQVEQPLIHKFEIELRKKGYILEKEIQDNGNTNLVYLVSHKGR